MPPELILSVQYASPAPQLPRWRLRRWVQHALKGAHQHAAGKLADIQALSLTLRLVDSAEGEKLNREFRQRDYATNVLTFVYGADPAGMLHADLVMCIPVLEQEASRQNKPLRNHAAHLTVHGVLHALGYDHTGSDDAHEMESLETALLARLGIPDPYLA